jgi:polyphosphate kinase
MVIRERNQSSIDQSDLISRDLSWLKFNYRVLDQARNSDRSLFDRLKFLAITASNLDEFFQIRVGSLYNYLDYGKERVDYSGLREIPFRKTLLEEAQEFSRKQNEYYRKNLKPLFEKNDFLIAGVASLEQDEKEEVEHYFNRTIFPMLTPMVYDSYHSFPILMNSILILAVVTKIEQESLENRKLSFVQIPQNLPRFYVIEREEIILFVPIEDIIKTYIGKLFRNVEILSADIFRIIRNGDFTIEESDDIEANFLEELRTKLKTRRTGRVVRLEVTETFNPWVLKILKSRWMIEDDNIFKIHRESLLDFTGLWQVIGHPEFKDSLSPIPAQVQPLAFPPEADDIFDVLSKQDVLLHHPYNSFEPVLQLLEKAAEDPDVLAIKMTIYRLAKNSRVTEALLKAAENGIHVSVLFEVKARFDEENNMKEAKRLQKAGCFVIYGFGNYKTHTKLMMIVRKEDDKITRYVHMSSGNYNEKTANIYTDLGLLTTNEAYANDVSEFFNVITGHSLPSNYNLLITSPRDMRKQLIELIRREAENSRNGLPAGISIKINSLEDKECIEELYAASQAGVRIKLIVRGICCLRPGRVGLSENISVISIVGDFLEHSRIFYFHNAGNPDVFVGSADMMVRSFDRRVESLFKIIDPFLRQQIINILYANLKDNVNAYILKEDGNYVKKSLGGQSPYNIHREFFRVRPNDIFKAKLFEPKPSVKEVNTLPAFHDAETNPNDSGMTPSGDLEYKKLN